MKVKVKESEVKVKEKSERKLRDSSCNARDLDLTPGLGRSPGKGNGKPLQYSYLENPMDRAAWQSTLPGLGKMGHD